MKIRRTGGFMKLSDPAETVIERAGTQAAAQRRAGHFRWSICALLFFAATVNYIDRQVIGILKPTLQDVYGWSEIDYSNIVFAFTTARR
jgi:ACS family hexuronate transporter-like MFS transporter